ncbi:MAG: alpha/beta hydrolase [Planctomycetes bacterium]|nr:alpha/beta hydrolase [Planctomycetota bacterium]
MLPEALRGRVSLLALVLAACVGRSPAADLAQPGPFTASRRDVTVVRSGGSTFAATMHYPATASTLGSPFDPAAGACPVVAFGHGFVTTVDRYVSTSAHLASWGFVVILPQTQGGLSPSHSALAADLVASMDWLAAESVRAGSPWFGSIDADRRGVMGHSMGGGCSLLAAAQDPRIRAAVPMAAADTNPSSVTASASVHCPTRLVVASQDTIVPPTTADPMFANLSGESQLLSITGGSHCGFIDTAILFCDSGSITRAAQLAIVRREVAGFLLVHLADRADLAAEVWGPAGSGTTRQARTVADLDGNGTVDAGDLGALLLGFGQPGRGDLDGNGTIDAGDIGAMLLLWGT